MKTKKRVTVKVGAPALPDPETGRLPKRISRKKRQRKRQLSPAKAEARRAAALSKPHPIAVTTKKRVTVQATPLRVKIARKRLPDLWDIPWDQRTEAQRLVNAQCSKFLAQTEAGTAGRLSTIRSAYATLFGVPAPASVDLEMVRMAVAYEHSVRSYVAAGVRIPDKVRMNHEAALKFNVSLFEYGMRSLMESHYRGAVNAQEKNMAKLKSVQGGKSKGGAPKFKGQSGTTSGLNIAPFIIQLFEANTKKRHSDEALAKILHKEFPESGRWSVPVNVKEVKSMRSLYNNGRIAPQGGVAPKVRLTEFDSKGQVVEGRAPRGSKKEKTAKPKLVVRKTALTAAKAKASDKKKVKRVA